MWLGRPRWSWPTEPEWLAREVTVAAAVLRGPRSGYTTNELGQAHRVPAGVLALFRLFAAAACIRAFFGSGAAANRPVWGACGASLALLSLCSLWATCGRSLPKRLCAFTGALAQIAFTFALIALTACVGMAPPTPLDHAARQLLALRPGELFAERAVGTLTAQGAMVGPLTLVMADFALGARVRFRLRWIWLPNAVVAVCCGAFAAARATAPGGLPDGQTVVRTLVAWQLVTAMAAVAAHAGSRINTVMCEPYVGLEETERADRRDEHEIALVV